MSSATGEDDCMSLLEDSDQFIPLGKYRLSGGGCTSSIRVTVAHNFTEYHGLEPKQEVIQYFDRESGRLVLDPQPNSNLGDEE